MYGEASIFGDSDLASLDFGVVKFFHPTALQANQVIVVSAAGKLKHGLAAFEVVAFEQSRLLELRQHPVHGGETDVLPLSDERSVNILGREMAYRAAFKQAEYSKARQRGLQAHGFEIV
jgi:purine nucleoside phosphorylase